MNVKDFKDIGLLDKLQNLKIEEYRYGNQICVVAPTWLINENLSLEDFLDDFANPKIKSLALRDFACMPQAGTRPFFPDASIIMNNANNLKKQPIDVNLKIADWFRPLSGVSYCLAFDLSIKRDATGGAMVHREFGVNYDSYILDFTFQMKAGHGSTIDYGAIRQLIRNLKKRRFKIGKVGFDQFQSHDSFLTLSEEGYDCEIVSYHDSLTGCGFVWDLIHQDRIEYGTCDSIFIGEAGELQVVNDKRIDHMETGGTFNSKDVWDAVVNACVLASRLKPPFQMECA